MAKISYRIIAEYKKLKLDKIINLSEIKSAKEIFARFNSDINKIIVESNHDSSHKVYSIIQNYLSHFSEELSTHDDFAEYYDYMVEMDEEYMPSFPPTSPLTGSYFTYWAFCDFKFGREKETINTIFSDIAKEFDFDNILLKGLSNLNKSCMRFYKHLGFDNGLIKLKDILTDEIYLSISTSNYKGQKNEIWYLRTVPNLDSVYDYHVSLTTPYVILNFTENDWLDYFKRQGIRKGESDFVKKYQSFMKNNLNIKYWHNYIMDGYVNHKPNCIYLTGIPDIKGSKPHEIGNEF